MLRNSDVATMMNKVSSTLSRMERSRTPAKPVVITPDSTDALGISALRQPAQLQIEFHSGSARPVVGRAIRFVKRAVRRGLRWYVGPIAEQQTRFNMAVLDLSERLRAVTDRLETQIVSLERSHDTLENSQRTQRAELERVVDRLRSDMEAVLAGTTGAVSADLPSTRYQLAYKAFEDRHRGSEEQIRKLLSVYLPHFRGRRRVLDVGCGRGEFLAMLRDEGVSAYGIDPDESMVEAAQARGLEVTAADVVTHLRDIDSGSIDGIISTQVIEHLSTQDLMGFLDLAYRKLAPGGVIVLETPNPESLFIFHSFFYVDLTHTKPIHPEALSWAMEASGFGDVHIERILACPDDVRLTQIPEDLIRKGQVWHTLATNIVRLNALLYGPQHYAGIGVKPTEGPDD